MASGLLIFGTVLLFVLVVALIFAIAIHSRSFKNRTMIARQTGEKPDDVVWMEDKFRVQKKSGFWIIQFKRLRERTTSIEGSFWTRFVKKNDSTALLRLTDDEWRGMELTKHVQRGIFFYETTEGELHPMRITRDTQGDEVFEVMSQENKIWLANEIKDINSLTRNRNKDLLVLGAIVLGILIFGVVIVFGIIYISEKNLNVAAEGQRACLEYYYAINNGTKSASQPQFLDNAVNVITQSGG